MPLIILIHPQQRQSKQEGFEILGYRIVSVDSTVLGAPEVWENPGVKNGGTSRRQHPHWKSNLEL